MHFDNIQEPSRNRGLFEFRLLPIVDFLVILNSETGNRKQETGTKIQEPRYKKQSQSRFFIGNVLTTAQPETLVRRSFSVGGGNLKSHVQFNEEIVNLKS